VAIRGNKVAAGWSATKADRKRRMLEAEEARPRQGRDARRTSREESVQQGAAKHCSAACPQPPFVEFWLLADWPVFIRFLLICLTAPAFLWINTERLFLPLTPDRFVEKSVREIADIW
jgi:hypothetical protein